MQVPPTSEELGYCEVVEVQEIGETNVVVFKRGLFVKCSHWKVLTHTHTHTDKEDSRIATVVIRGSTANIMDDVERSVDDAVNTYKSLTKDSRFVPGAGATEIELAKQLTSFGEVSSRWDHQMELESMGCWH